MQALPHRPSYQLPVFIAIWMVLSFLQAALVNIDADEAYYWLLSQNLNWGYFDHPPFVTIAIRVGETFGHGAFFTRMITVLSSAGTLYFGFKLLPAEWRNIKTYLLIFASAVLFHLYSFITTPDAFLLFFTVFFFYRYKEYLQQQSAINILLLALSITGLLYSKYHGVLPVAFTFLSNPRLVRKPSAWVVAGLVLLAFSPHLYWQYGHHWPTVRYHLSERIASEYRLSKTTDYIIAQAFIWGPFTTLPALYLLIRKKLAGDVYVRAHYFNFFGILLFFLLSSFRSSIEAHWTLAAGPSFVLLLHAVMNKTSARFQKNFSWLLYGNIALIMLARLALVVPGTPLKTVSGLRAMTLAKPWADSLYSKAAGHPIVFPDSYSSPALYRFYYPGEEAIGYNTTNYRKTNFNISDDEALLNNRTVFIAWPSKIAESDIAVTAEYMNSYLHKLDSFKSVNGMQVMVTDLMQQYKAGDSATVELLLTNKGKDTIYTNGVQLSYVFLKTRKKQFHSPLALAVGETFFRPGDSKKFIMPLRIPAEKGTYSLIYSIVQPPFAGNFASEFYKIKVE